MSTGKSVDFPLPGLSGQQVIMTERSNFSYELAAKYPSIKSFQSVHHTPAIYADTYDGQVHVFFRDKGETYFIEPLDLHSDLYVVRTTTSILSGTDHDQLFSCKTQEPGSDHALEFLKGFREKQADKINLKTYRLALAVTAEFASTLGNTKEKIMAGLNNHLTRINAVYVNENAIQFKLVPNNDTLIFTDPTDQPYTNGNVSKMIGQNVTVLNERIGLNNFDIGHVFGTNDGGLAQLSSVCTANKAAAASCSFGVYSGELFYTIPCHEMGHSFSATHIFNFCDNSNETSSSAFEPGSGSTIMSYAGASNCGQNYVQSIQDPYFNAFSLQQIKTYSRSGIGNLCGTTTLINNEPPQVTIVSPAGVTIPKSTPFELEGSGSDDKSLALDFTWEEMDLGQMSILGSPTGTAPLFRSVIPGRSPHRVFPSLLTLLNNKSSVSEVLPSNTRPLNFRLSARDNDPSGGGVSWSDVSIQSTATAGPFKVASLNDSAILFKQDALYIIWDIANTVSAPVNCKSVDILWSTDGGNTYKKYLSRDTPNDGGEWIILPNEITDLGRIKIKASGNVFFDINNINLKVIDQLSPTVKIYTNPDQLSVCAGTSTSIIIKASAANTKDSFRLSSNLINDPNISVSFGKNFLSQADSIPLILSIKSLTKPADKIITIFGINQRTGDSIPLNIKLRIVSDYIGLIQPAYGQDQVPATPVFKWQSIPNTEDYVIEISEVPGFNTIAWSKNLAGGDTIAISGISLKSNQIYYWRLRSILGCNKAQVNFSVFHTQALVCKSYAPADLPKLISATGTPRIFSEIVVTDSLRLSLITLPIVRGAHDFIGDLTMTLQAPNGDSIILWTKQCNNLSNFNLSLDDQAPIALSCPLTDRKAHRPEQSFNNLFKSKTKGSWKLIIKDNASGAGGSLDEWTLQLCGAITAPSPLLKSNKTIELVELKVKTITRDFLEFTDADSDAGKLKYFLLQQPQKGNLLLNNISLGIGSVFTQVDINTNKLSYQAFSVSADTSEEISFLVVDEANNWSGVQTLKVLILNDSTIAVKKISEDISIKVFPNPFDDHLSVENLTPYRLKAVLSSVEGKQMQFLDINAFSTRTFTIHVPPGIYILQPFNDNTRFRTLKVVAR
jgi:subtilisin-like proprotein convertase family protein